VRSGRRPAGRPRLRRPRKAGPVARYGAPAGFLLAATVAILLIHSALGGKTVPAPPRSEPPPTTTVVRAKPTPKPRPRPAGRFHVVQSGEGFAAIAAAEHTTVAQIERLNPGVSSSSLHVGQKIRVG
jgi:LysM repeat protein